MRCNVSYVNYLASFRFLFERPELADQSRPASGPDSGPALIQRPLVEPGFTTVKQPLP